LLEGDTFYTKVSSKDTDNDLYIYESTRVKEGGPPLHYHTEVDEWWYILKGEFLIKVGEETYNVKAGDSVFGPRMVPHAFAKIGKGDSKLLMLFQPAGKMEAFFQAISEGVPAKMSKEQQETFRKEHGIVWVGPALRNLKGWQTE
jgi:mannose-6-phosphate isomerase-like protein (cupin superfamily)